jgi:predicted GNAT family N-acyltransferase
MDMVYREPISKDELAELLRLRQDVFSNHSDLSQMLAKNTTIDLDYFDLNSTHYGGFKKGKAISYVRLVGRNKNHQTKWVEQIALSHKLTLTKSSYDFPFQRYYPNPVWSKNFIDSLQNRNIGEMGKLAIHPDFRNDKTHLNRLVESFLSHCVNELKIETGFGSCTLILERYYKKFGFFPARECVPFIYKDLPKAVILQFNA